MELNPTIRHSPGKGGPLTLVADEEAHAGPAIVCGEEEVHEIPCADEELRRLCAVVLPDQRGRAGWPVSDLQGVIINFCLESVGKHIQSEERCRAALTYRQLVISFTY